MKKTYRFLTLLLASFLAIGCSPASNGNSNKPGGSNDSAIHSDKVVEDIAIKTLPKVDYVIGETFSIDNGVIELQYEDGTTSDLPFSNDKVTISTPDMSTTGVKTVIVDYDGFKAQYQITVKKQSYLVTLDLNYDGATNPSPIEVVAGEYANKPANPSRENYKFVNWCTDKAGQNEFDFSTTVINSNITLYANWEQEFAIYFDLDNGSAASKVAASLNAPILMNAAPSVLREGYQFLGWYNGDTLYDFATPVTAVLNLKAHWKTIDSNKAARTVTIDYNAGEAYQPVSFYVEDGATTFTPSNPVIEGKEFQGWYKAATGAETFDFTVAISADTTIYAHYKVDYYTVNFKYVANGEETIFKSQQIAPGGKATSVAQKPRVDNYLFDGNWYSDKACTVLFDFNQEINADYDLYTKALKKNTFEAEYTNIEASKPGVGSSDSFNGLKLIFEDNGTAEASNGYWVSGLYYNGAFIEYVIYSEKAFNDGQLEMSLSSEWADIYLAPQETTSNGQAYHAFEVAVYDAQVDEGGNLVKDNAGYTNYVESTKKTVDYAPIALEGAITFDISMTDKRPFTNHFMTDKFTMNAGYNVVRLTVKNSVPPYDGTMDAHAPMIDNMVIYTDSVLSWTPKEENVADWHAINYAENKHPH